MVNPVPEAGESGPLVAQAVERMAAAKIAVGLPPLVVLGLYGLVQSLRYGLQPPENVVMAIGAVLSIAAMVFGSSNPGKNIRLVTDILRRVSVLTVYKQFINSL